MSKFLPGSVYNFNITGCDYVLFKVGKGQKSSSHLEF